MAIAVHIVTEVEDRDSILQMTTLVCHDFQIFHTTIQTQSRKFNVDHMVPFLCKGELLEEIEEKELKRRSKKNHKH